jgi:hypothetical protein
MVPAKPPVTGGFEKQGERSGGIDIALPLSYRPVWSAGMDSNLRPITETLGLVLLS